MKENLPQRKSIRLKNYDYSSEGMYFVTICIKNRENILGTIHVNNINVGANSVRPEREDKNKIILSNIGVKINNEINRMRERYVNVVIEKYVIMPNHIHMIIVLDEIIKRANRVRPYNITNYKTIQRFYYKTNRFFYMAKILS